jgi:hypothetical protein
MKKTTRDLSKDSWRRIRDSKPGLPECKFRIFTPYQPADEKHVTEGDLKQAERPWINSRLKIPPRA